MKSSFSELVEVVQASGKKFSEINKKVNIIDLGEGRKAYSPIRMCYDEIADSNNEKLMVLSDKDFDKIVNSIEANISKV